MALTVVTCGLCLVTFHATHATSLATESRFLVVEFRCPVVVVGRTGVERILAEHVRVITDSSGRDVLRKQREGEQLDRC